MDNLNTATTKPKLFISYARADDKLFVEKLYNSLSGCGFDVWWDMKSMPSRALTFLQEIRDTIDERERLILVVGPNAASSEYVRAEWQYALAVCKTINPILRIGDYGQIPEVADFQTPDFRDDSKYDDALQSLLGYLNDSDRELSPLRGVPALPPNYLHRPKDVEAITSKVLADTQKPVVISAFQKAITLQGMGGIGKSVLASVFAHSCEARKSFKDGIIWLSIGKPPDTLKAMQIIGNSFNDNPNHYKSLGEAASRLPELLQKRHCLIVLDDVWNIQDIEPFINALGTETLSRLLITTRDIELANSVGGENHSVDLLSPTEALTLLRQWSGLENLPSEAPDVAKQCGYLPLALAMIGAMVKGKPLDRWQNALHKLQNADLEKIKRQFPNYAYPNLLAAIQVSVEALDEEEPKAKARYIDFAVFAEDTQIPEETLRAFWTRDGVGLNLDDSQDIIDKLVARSLLRRDTSGTLTIHDLQLDYVRKQIGDLQDLQNEFVNAYRQKCTDGWHSGPDDGYFYDHLVEHLYASNNSNEAESLYLSQDWMRKRFKVNNSRYDGVVRDLEAIWINRLHTTTLKQIATSNDFDPFSACFRFSLIRTSMNSLVYSPQLVLAAIKHNIWQSALAVSMAERIPDAAQRVELCTTLLNEVPLSEEQQIKLHRLFFNATSNLPNYTMIVEALKKIGPVLHETYLDDALLLAQNAYSLAERTEGLVPLLSRLNEERQQHLLSECLNQIDLEKDGLDRGRALAHIAPFLNGDLIEKAIHIIEGLQGQHQRSIAIIALVPRLNEDQIRRVYQLTMDVKEGKERAQIISSLADKLPDDLIDNAIVTVEGVDEFYARITALVDLSLRIDAVRRNCILDRVFEDIEKNDNSFARSDFPSQWLYDKLPDEYRIRAIKSSLQIATLVNGWHRERALGYVLFRLCKRDDLDSFTEMFDSSFYNLLHMAVRFCNTLAQLVPYLPEYYRGIAVQTIREALELPFESEDEIEQRQAPKDRLYWIAQILPYLAMNEREATFDIALNSIFSFPQQNDVFEGVNTLIPSLNADEVRRIISKLSEITDYSSRTGALARIARQLSGATQVQIIEKILYEYLPKMLTEREKSYAIAQLSPLLGGEHLQHCMNLIAEFEEEAPRAGALANIANLASQPPIDEIYNIAQSLSDDDARSLLLEALADKITPLQISQGLDFIVSLSNVERKTRILASVGSKLTLEQIRHCCNRIQQGGEQLINIVIAAGLLSVMPSDDMENYLEDAVNVILSTNPGTSQFGIAWAVASIVPYLDQGTRDKVCNFAFHSLVTMPGNHAAYPGGNPKINAFKKLIPCLDGEMQERALREIKTIPHLMRFAGEADNPTIDVLEDIVPTLADDFLPATLDLLQEPTDEWSHTKALEAMAARLPEASFPQYLEVVDKIPSTWMRARAFAALLETYTPTERIIDSVRKTLLEHLVAFQGQSRNELLWSIDVRLFKNPYIEEKTLEKIVRHIIEICDEWDWSMPA